jgi:hypothetical protein
VNKEKSGNKLSVGELIIRKLAKSGNARYLCISTILPRDWVVVRVFIEESNAESCLLRIIPLK